MIIKVFTHDQMSSEQICEMSLITIFIGTCTCWSLSTNLSVMIFFQIQIINSLILVINWKSIQFNRKWHVEYCVQKTIFEFFFS